MDKVKIRVCIALLAAYVLAWVLIILVPTLGLEPQQSDLYTSYLLIAEEVLLLACVIIIGPMFITDIKAKLTGSDNKQ
ncbi:hypothetical protein VIN01S_25220 [Vibrio inusitatus NBRC 102082]|uniref:Uncharacterized protein n=1 Tax=Vibrio inusitatus NBRC 102082 TaxID=1219070 RepID=A0A4Y3HXH4_9VIBR|nr:hypothetical protein [Vibrio inusitatus]GEA51718.1 hypothetical protein VIN01S_25220 [Vibrio inusitatus NBRC 102082]